MPSRTLPPTYRSRARRAFWARLASRWAALGLLSANALALNVVDDAGRSVVLQQPARRIIGLAPHATELLFDVEAGDAVIAASDYSDYPDEAKLLPRVGGAQGLDLERIVSLRPDLVVAWTSGNSARELEAIERAGIAVFRSDPHNLTAIAQNLESLGVLTGHAAAGQAAARQFLDRIHRLEQAFSHRSVVTVFYQVWDKPLMTIGGRHVISDVIRLCGGRNIFADLEPLAPRVDAEAVMVANPQVIALASDRGRAASELAQWQAWPLDAIRHHHVVILDPALITRSTPRIAEGAEQLCEGIDSARDASLPARPQPP